jgi:hypothetical protein
MGGLPARREVAGRTGEGGWASGGVGWVLQGCRWQWVGVEGVTGGRHRLLGPELVARERNDGELLRPELGLRGAVGTGARQGRGAVLAGAQPERSRLVGHLLSLPYLLLRSARPVPASISYPSSPFPYQHPPSRTLFPCDVPVPLFSLPLSLRQV